MILWCGKIGEGGMERKTVNNRAFPGMSGPLLSKAWATRDVCGWTGISEGLKSALQREQPNSNCALNWNPANDLPGRALAMPMSLSDPRFKPLSVERLSVVVVSHLSKNICIDSSSSSPLRNEMHLSLGEWGGEKNLK